MLEPEKRLEQGNSEWSVYSEEQTGLRLVALEDRETGVVVTTSLANPQKRTAAHKAWAGARHSRAAGMPWEIMHEMGEKGVDPDQKLEEMFKGYGHASVGDMARLEVDVVNVPMHVCLNLFNESSVNSGQEKSTRYQQRFGRVLLHPLSNYLPEGSEAERAQLEESYQDLGQLSLDLFAKHRKILTGAYTDFYRPENKDQVSALNSRVLDSVRYFLLLGQSTGMSMETSVRDWSRLIGIFKGSHLSFYNRLAGQVEQLLTPDGEIEAALGFKAEAPGLIRHTSAETVTNKNLLNLATFVSDKTDLFEKVHISRGGFAEQDIQLVALMDNFTVADKMVAQYILTLWPGLQPDELLQWVTSASNETKMKIGELIFSGHNNYHELPSMAATKELTLLVEGYLGELRDFNRHRAWSRFVNLPLLYGPEWSLDTANQILSKGYGLPLYLEDVPAFFDIGNSFNDDLGEYYDQLEDFISQVDRGFGSNIDYAFVANLLPLAHRVDLWMHGDPKQVLYLTSQRTRPGGHINYRSLAYSMNVKVVGSDPYLHGMFLDSKAPDPASREEFFDRS